MNKKILIGSILAIALILLMPSIPAIQQKTIEDKVNSDFLEEIKALDDDVKYPKLYMIILFILFEISLKNIIRLKDISTGYIPHFQITTIEHLLLFLLYLLLGFTFIFRVKFWQNLSNILGWNWNITMPN